MKLKSEFRPNDTGADIFLLGAGQDPQWMMLRWNRAENRISGYLGSPAHGGLPPVRPVSYVSPSIEETTVGTVALWAFMSAANMQAAYEGMAVKSSLEDQLSEWDSFLAGTNAKRDPARDASRQMDDPNSIFLTIDQHRWMKTNGFTRDIRGSVMPARRNGFRTGAPVSGFQAMTVRDAVSKIFHQIPRAAVADIDAARRALSAVGRPSSRAVFWYGNAEGQDRAQAASSYPVLAGMIADNPIMARAVDNREPLQGELMERTGLGKAALKRLSNIKTGLPAGRIFEEGEAQRGADALGVNRERRFPVSGELSLDNALKVLSTLPPDRVPQDDQSWKAFHDIVSACAIPIENTLGIPVEKTLSACKGDWVQFHAQLARSADFEPAEFDRRLMVLTTIDALEAIEDFSRTAVLPLTLSSITSTEQEVPEVSGEFFTAATQVATRVCTGNAKNQITSLFEMARRYASRIPALNEATGELDFERGGRVDAYEPGQYPKLCRPFVATNGRVVRSLDSHDLLREESARLRHCVGRAYLSKAERVGCHILSVQDADGETSFSTIEFSALRGQTLAQAIPQLTQIQHRANFNRAPDPECIQAISEFKAAIKSGEVRLNFDEIAAYRENIVPGLTGGVPAGDQTRRVAQISWRGVIGMEWEEPERRQTTWSEWRYIMGGQVGKAETPDVIFRDQGARDLVASMNPKAAALLIQRQVEAREAAARARELAAEAEAGSPAP